MIKPFKDNKNETWIGRNQSSLFKMVDHEIEQCVIGML